MKAGWEVKTIKDIAVIDWGNTDLTKSAFVEEGPFLGVSAAGCDGRMMHAEHKRLTPVLSAIGAQCGRMFLPTEDFTAIKNTITLTPIEGKCDSVFLYYLLTFVELPQRGAGQPFISKGDIQKFIVSVPPLDEQGRIVEVLDAAFEGLSRARAHTETNLQNARELFEVRRAAIFSAGAEGEEAEVGDVCLGFEYGTAAKSLPEGKMPVLRMGNLQDGEIDWTDLVYSDDPADCARYVLKAGDVLFNRTNSAAHVGKTSIFDGKMPAIFAGYLIRVTPDPKKLTPQFLNHFLNSNVAREYGRSVMGTSVNQANISGSRLKGYTIRYPSLERQAELADELDQLKAEVKILQSHYRVKLADLDALRQSLLQKAFAGELT